MICPLKAPSSNTNTQSNITWITSQSQRSGKKPLFDVKVTRGSDVDSDYHRVIGMFEMKLAQEYNDDSRRY